MSLCCAIADMTYLVCSVSSGRNGNFTPFNLTAQGNTSTQGLLSAAGFGRSAHDRATSVHKPPLNGDTPDMDDVSDVSSPYSPSSGYSQTATTMYGTTSEGGYLHQQTLHRRRPTSDLGHGDTTIATSDVPPPSYQASLGTSAEAVPRTIVEKS